MRLGAPILDGLLVELVLRAEIPRPYERVLVATRQGIASRARRCPPRDRLGLIVDDVLSRSSRKST
jgi:hypothetical protein